MSIETLLAILSYSVSIFGLGYMIGQSTNKQK